MIGEAITLLDTQLCLEASIVQVTQLCWASEPNTRATVPIVLLEECRLSRAPSPNHQYGLWEGGEASEQ